MIDDISKIVGEETEQLKTTSYDPVGQTRGIFMNV